MAHALLIRCPFSEAHLLRIALERAGLEVELRGAMRSGLFGVEGPEDSASELWVDEQALVRAQQVLAELETTAPTREEDEWACATCGEKNPVNFQICWNCQANMKDGTPVEILPPKEDPPRPPPGPSRLPIITALLVVTVILLSAMLIRELSQPRYVESSNSTVQPDGDDCVIRHVDHIRRARWCDFNHDGTNELYEAFDGEGLLVQRSHDNDNDHRAELVELFDKDGRIWAREYDENADGRYEKVEVLDKQGRVRRTTEDTVGDGRPDLVDERLPDGTHYVYREQADGRSDLEVHAAGHTKVSFTQTDEGWR